MTLNLYTLRNGFFGKVLGRIGADILILRGTFVNRVTKVPNYVYHFSDSNVGW